jgi:hypothetical protein
MAYLVPQKPGAHMTPKSTKLSGPGGYTTTTPTLKGGAGDLKPMGGGKPMKVGNAAASPFSGGKKGSNKDTQALLKNVKRTVI